MKPGENKTGFDSMLRRGLSTDATPAARNCPGADLLAAYYERSLAPAETALLDLHFASCSRCRAQMAAMVRSDEAATAQPRSAGSWLWRWPWLAPVVAAAAIVLVWAGIHEHNKTSKQRVLVAMSSATEVTEEVTPAAPATPPAVPEQLAEPRRAQTNRLTARSATPSAGAAYGVPATDSLSLQRSQIQQEPPAPAAKAAQPEPGASSVAGVAPGVAGGASAGAAGRPVGGVIGGVVTPEAPAPEDKPLPATLAQTESAEDTSVSKEKSTRIAASAAPGASVTSRRYAMTAKKPAASAAGQMKAANAALAPILIATPEAKTYWRIDVSGSIQFSADSGQTWITQTERPAGQMKSGFAPSVKICWIVGRDGVVLRTLNGKDWNQVVPPAPVDLVAVYASSAKHAQVTAADGSVYGTKNGGKSWNKLIIR